MLAHRRCLGLVDDVLGETLLARRTCGVAALLAERQDLRRALGVAEHHVLKGEPAAVGRLHLVHDVAVVVAHGVVDVAKEALIELVWCVGQKLSLAIDERSHDHVVESGC